MKSAPNSEIICKIAIRISHGIRYIQALNLVAKDHHPYESYRDLNNTDAGTRMQGKRVFERQL